MNYFADIFEHDWRRSYPLLFTSVQFEDGDLGTGGQDQVTPRLVVFSVLEVEALARARADGLAQAEVIDSYGLHDGELEALVESGEDKHADKNRVSADSIEHCLVLGDPLKEPSG